MKVRLTSGLNTGKVIEADDYVAESWVLSGHAECVEEEPRGRHAAPEVPETPEDTVEEKKEAAEEEEEAPKPKPTPRRRRKSPAAETR